MSSSKILYRVLAFGAAVIIYSVAGMALAAHGAEIPKPVAGKVVHFPDGTWSGLPQTGPNGKVRQCVMIAERPRAGPDGKIDTDFSVDISAGSGLTFGLSDDKLPTDAILDDEAEVILDGKPFPAVAFTSPAETASSPSIRAMPRLCSRRSRPPTRSSCAPTAAGWTPGRSRSRCTATAIRGSSNAARSSRSRSISRPIPTRRFCRWRIRVRPRSARRCRRGPARPASRTSARSAAGMLRKSAAMTGGCSPA